MDKRDRDPVALLYEGVQLVRPLLRNITKRVEADLEGTGVSVGQRAILEALLGLSRATAPQLTRALDVKRQFVARELQDLHARGLVEQTGNPAHKTSAFYSLTPGSHALITAIRAREQAEFARFAAGYAREEIEAFHRIISALNAGMKTDTPVGD
ncbi:MarR family winged helix-turn-helix transcriptional regulator [Roseicyclus persicicus]|uniref:MarR family transcriptional regulator n=1 Tax=Roseicyclus persicicus TaxID=2650661 RepID=A0A7X6JYM4_9RHOB|nr:MarR family transcriptional regulator [Roseibacterium persicicum]NKX44639.1 MarR family transcriptional regulator [Roseibacterium persicicum]